MAEKLGVFESWIATFIGLALLIPGAILIGVLAAKFGQIGLVIGIVITIAYMIPASIYIYKWITKKKQ